MIRFLLLCSCHLRSPCGFWCWLTSCWVLPPESFGCVVPLLLLCWWRTVLLLRCWVLLLIVCGCRSVLLRPWTWWQSPLLTSALWHILPSRCRRRHPTSGVMSDGFDRWSDVELVVLRALWCIVNRCFSFRWSAVVGSVKDLASSLVAVADVWSGVVSSTVVCRLPVGMLCVPLCWVVAQGLCCWPLFLVLVMACRLPCLLRVIGLLCTCPIGWPHSNHPCWWCSCRRSWWCCRLWDLLLAVVEGAAGCLWKVCPRLLVLQGIGDRPRSIVRMRCLLLFWTRLVLLPIVPCQVAAVFLLNVSAMRVGCCVERRWLCWASILLGVQGCRILSVEA